MNGSALVLGAFFFAFQIYGDFSGYSDIAIGIARLFGFSLMQNFNFPYFSRDIAEFWRRWHISLSSWFRDYLYIPLGGSRGTLAKKIRNTFAIFIVSGFWHGANWTFIAWGALNALYFLPLLLANRNRIHTGAIAHTRFFPNSREFLSITLTFVLTVLAWIFFRADNIRQALSIVNEIFSPSLFLVPNNGFGMQTITALALILIFMLIEWAGRHGKHALQDFAIKWKRPWRLALYYAIILAVFWFGGSAQEFIYFQF